MNWKYHAQFYKITFSIQSTCHKLSLLFISTQVCRALVPVIVMAISMFYYGKQFSFQRKLSVLPIVFGVALAFYGDMSFTPIGAFYTLFCVVLAALKAVAGGELLTGDLKLHEIDLLSKMCPLALLQIGLVSLLTGTYIRAYFQPNYPAHISQPCISLNSPIKEYLVCHEKSIGSVSSFQFMCVFLLICDHTWKCGVCCIFSLYLIT